jgi:hypothetical protein
LRKDANDILIEPLQTTLERRAQGMKKVVLSLLLAALTCGVEAEDFSTASSSGKTRIDWTTVPEIGWGLTLFRHGSPGVQIPDPEYGVREGGLGTSNFPDRKFRWFGERYCVSTLESGFGIIDTLSRKWVCNLSTRWGFSWIRTVIVYVSRNEESQTHDELGIYKFDDGKPPQLRHITRQTAGLVISPFFEGRYRPQIAYVELLPNKTAQLVVFDTTSDARPLAVKRLPERFDRRNPWSTDLSKEARVRNLELLEWICSATKYGPFWEPDGDHF